MNKVIKLPFETWDIAYSIMPFEEGNYNVSITYATTHEGKRLSDADYRSFKTFGEAKTFADKAAEGTNEKTEYSPTRSKLECKIETKTRLLLNDAYQYGLQAKNFDAETANIALNDLNYKLLTIIKEIHG